MRNSWGIDSPDATPVSKLERVVLLSEKITAARLTLSRLEAELSALIDGPTPAPPVLASLPVQAAGAPRRRGELMAAVIPLVEQGLTPVQIADALGSTLDNIRMCIKRAHRKGRLHPPKAR